jgi:hypothetical protein
MSFPTIKSVGGFPTERLPLPGYEILHHLRGSQEARHRRGLYEHSNRCFYKHDPRIKDMEGRHMPDMTLAVADDCCNKFVPIYILRAPDYTTCPVQLLLIVLHNYLYRK